MVNQSFVLCDQFPAELLSLNRAYKMNRHTRRAIEVAWRDAVFWLTKAHRPPKFTSKVRVSVTFVVRDPERRRDSHNFVATLKPMVDGLVLAGLLVDDDTEHLVNDDITFTGPFDHHKPNTFIMLVREECP